jgi:hypothetical protein
MKFAMPKACLKINSKYYFYKVYALILKGLFSNHISIMQNKVPWTIYKVLFKNLCNYENMLLTDLK